MIMFATCLLSRFIQDPTETHFTATKRILRYMKGTLDYGLIYLKQESNQLVGFSDSDCVGSLDDSKSTRRFCYSFGSIVFALNSKKQQVVAQSTVEAEYIVCAAAANHTLWLRKLLVELGFKQEKGTLINVDNLSTIAIAKNPVQHGSTKHIKVKYHVLRDAVKEGEIELLHCLINDQLVDIFTKRLGNERFEYLRFCLGVLQIKNYGVTLKSNSQSGNQATESTGGKQQL